MSGYRETIRLAREVEEVREALERATTREDVDALAGKVAALHPRVEAALVAHASTQPWYSRWVWTFRLWRFNRKRVAS